MMGHNPVFHDGKSLFGEIADEIITRLDDLGTKGMIQVLQASAKMTKSNDLLFRSIGDTFIDKVDFQALPPTDIAKIVT